MKKIKKIWQNKIFKNYFLLIIVFTSEELIFRLIEHQNLLSYSSLRIFLGLNILALTFSLLVSFTPKLFAKIFNLILAFLTTIYGLAQLGFNNFLGVYASIQVNSQAEAVSAYVLDFIKSFKPTFYLMLLPFLFLLIYYLFLDSRLTLDLPRRKINTKTIIAKVGLGLTYLALIFGYYGTMKFSFMQNNLQGTKSYEIFLKPTTPSLVVNDFGYIAFGLLDLKEYFFPGPEIDTKIEYDPNQVKDPITTTPEYKPQTSIDNATLKDIISQETNNNYNNLNKYFISATPSNTNQYTGLFKDKNLIVIMIESGSNLLLNEEYYPNMAKLYQGGFSWSNNYSPRNSCSTGNNELSAMTGLYSIYNNCTANVYQNNTYFASIFNLFNDQGYTTNSFHNHFDAYYYRTTIHKNMGSQKFYKVQDMKIPYGHEYGDWASDELMMEFYLKTLDNLDDTKPFMSWITTVTSHQPYSISRIFSDEYLDLFPRDLPNDVRSYMSRLKVVDNAIGILLDGLEERGLLKDTVIALFADHYPYAISLNNLSTVLDYDLKVDNNADQVPFIIYNSELSEGKQFLEYTSYINLTPTLANLFNLDFDSRFFLGSDVLSPDYESLVVFADGSWKNKYAYYNAGTNKINYYTQKVYSDEEILAINEKISLKLKMSSLAIKSNYFNYLKKKLDSYNPTSE